MIIFLSGNFIPTGNFEFPVVIIIFIPSSSSSPDFYLSICLAKAVLLDESSDGHINLTAELLPIRHTDGPVLPIYAKPMDTMAVLSSRWLISPSLVASSGLWTSMAMLLCATTSSVETGTIARCSPQRRHVQCSLLHPFYSDFI